MPSRPGRPTQPALIIALLLAAVLLAAPMLAQQRVIVLCQTDCSGVEAATAAAGGTTYMRLSNVPVVGVDVSDEMTDALMARDDVVSVSPDLIIERAPVEKTAVSATDAQPLSAADVTELAATSPSDYSFNNTLIGADAFQAAGNLGQTLVAVIDSGTANNAGVVPALAGSVIGGESFVPLAEDPVTSATSTANDPHGTWVGTVIAGHAAFLFLDTSTLVQSLQVHAPGSVVPFAPGISAIPMIGVAPAASLYALKVFPSNGGGAPTSRTLQAMDRAITLRRNFDAGVPSTPTNPGCGAENDPCVYDSLPIQVVNMSFGGGEFFSGREVGDRLTEEMLEVGIVPVASAGNSGPAALTTESPANGLGSLAVGAAATAEHTRVLFDLIGGLGFGQLFRPSDGVQLANFSSRGATPDGRFGVDLVANGFATFVQGASGSINLVNGTSFSAPTVAGAAAVLRVQFPSASATNLRNALEEGANRQLLAHDAEDIDQGDGFLDIQGAADKLESGHVSSFIPRGLSTPSVEVNIAPTGLRPERFFRGRSVSHIRNLEPGEVEHLLIETDPRTERLTFTIQNVTPELPPAQQNQLFGDDILFTVNDAPTTFNALLVSEFVAGDSTFVVNQPQSGLVRVAVQGDTSNAGRISLDLVIEREETRLPLIPTANGLVQDGETDEIPVDVPAGTSQLDFLLSNAHDWGHYPTDVLILAAFDPNGNLVFDNGLSSPKRLSVSNPVAGRWSVLVIGGLINDRLAVNDRDLYQLRVTADGKTLRKARN